MKKDYMTRLEQAARWRLPPQEAEDVIADYRDIVGTPPRPDEELIRDLGKPRDVIRPLARTKECRIWLAAFAVMAACILTLGISPTMIGFPFWQLFFDSWVGHPYDGGAAAAALGAVLALVWFRWQGHKEGRLPQAIPVLLAVFLVCIGGVLWLCWAFARDFEGCITMWGTVRPWIGPDRLVSASVYLLTCAMGCGGTVISFIGAFALGKARIRDRRWAAVYVLALAAMLAALSVVRLTMSMEDPDLSVEDDLRSMLVRCSVIAAVGLAGAGVALC